MIVAFITMFLGLMGGVRPVELAVAEPVAQVEILLDGASVGTLTQEPWSLEVDFGTELAPHLLVAVARDSAGAELGRAEQWLNLPRPPAEVEILLSSDDGGGPPRTAQLIWQSASHSAPEEVVLHFDGRPLTVKDPQRIALPRYRPEETHFLRAVVRFSPTVEAAAEAVFGGAFGSTVSTEMQAVAVAIDKKRRLPPAAELSGWLAKDGKPLTVLAAEEGLTDIVMVVDLAAQKLLRELLESNIVGSTRTPRRRRPAGLYYDEPIEPNVGYRLTVPHGIDDDDRLRFVSPVPGEVPTQDPYLLFPTSAPLAMFGGGIFEIMTIADMPVKSVDKQCLADALAVAGTTAFAGNRRRCAVLVVGSDPIDRSRWNLPAVRRYLSRLGVPLMVWRIVARGQHAKEAPELGEFMDISSIKGVRDAINALSRELKAQRILWVDGHHLPQQVEIGAAASGVRLVGVSR